MSLLLLRQCNCLIEFNETAEFLPFYGWFKCGLMCGIGNDRPASCGEGRGSATVTVVDRFLIRNEAKIFASFAVA